MKSSLFFLFAAAVWAQSAAPQAVSPASPASAPAALPQDTVVATFGDGRNLTVGELDSFLAAMPPNMAQAARRDRRAFVQQFALMHRLSEMAERAKLDQQSPTREALAFNRMYLLMNAQLHEKINAIAGAPPEGKGFYVKKKNASP